MGKKSGGGGSTESTNYTSNIPEWLQYPSEDVIGRAEYESQIPYQPYGGQRISDFNDLQTDAFGAYVDVFDRPLDGLYDAMDMAQEGAGDAGYIDNIYYTPQDIWSGFSAEDFDIDYGPTSYDSGYSAWDVGGEYAPGEVSSDFSPGDITSSFNPGGITAQNNATSFSSDYSPGGVYSRYNAGDIGSDYVARGYGERLDPNSYDFSQNYSPLDIEGELFGQEEADQYMNPYITNVLDVLQEREQENYLRDKTLRQSDAIASGAFGGSRLSVEETAAQDDYLRRLRENEANQLMQGFYNAQDQFGRDRDARFQAEGMNDASRQFKASLGLESDIAAGNMGISAFGENLGAYLGEEQARQQQEGLRQSAWDLSERAGQVEGDQGLQADIASEGFQQVAAELGLTAQQYSDLSNQFYSNLDLQAQDISMGYDQAAANMDLQAQDLSMGYDQASADLDLQAQMANESFNQFAAEFGLNRDQINEQNAQFAADQRLQEQQFEDASQQFYSNLGLTADDLTQQGRRQEAQMDMEADTTNEQNWQNYGDRMFATDEFNNQQLENYYQRQFQGGDSLAALQGQEQAMDMDRIGQMLGVGQAYQGMEQQQLEQAYMDFVNQRDYERGNIDWLNRLIGNNPGSNSRDQMVTSYTETDPISQAASLGIGGLGLLRGSE